MLVAKALATPIFWVVGLLVLGLVLSRGRRRKPCGGVGWWVLLAGTLMLLVLSLRPTANVLTYSLEHRYGDLSHEALRALDVVVVLGGGTHAAWGYGTEAELTGPAYSRWYNGILAFHRSGANLLAFSGGRLDDDESEAEVMKSMAVAMGIPEDRILVETQSLNTMQNAAFTARLLPGKGRQIGLVTSVTHMLRAERAFKKEFRQDTIVPIPVNYTYDPWDWTVENVIPSATALEESTVALHEWVGLLWYSLRYR